MNLQDMTTVYSALPKSNQIAFLARLSWELTVRARDTYVAGTEDVKEPSRLRTFNEVQHRITGELCHLVEGNSARRPDDVMAEFLWESAVELGFERLMGQWVTDAAKVGNTRPPAPAVSR